MIQINIGDHRSRYWKQGWGRFPRHRLDDARWARSRALAVARGNPSANAYFLRLPKARSLTDLLSDRRIWVNFAYTLPYARYGEAEEGGTELAISESACRIGKWSVLATLIHELAHINGVPGQGHAAEGALVACGLGRLHEHQSGIDDPHTPYMPGLEG